MGKLFKQNFFVSLYAGESQFKDSSIFAATVFNAAISLFLFLKVLFFIWMSTQLSTEKHWLAFCQFGSAIELCDFFHGNFYSALTDISKCGSCVSSRDAAPALGRGFFKFFTLSARYMCHADNVEVNPFFLDSPAYCKRLQSISDRNSSVEFLFKAVKDWHNARTRGCPENAECGMRILKRTF